MDRKKSVLFILQIIVTENMSMLELTSAQSALQAHNVETTSIQRHDVESTLFQHCNPVTTLSRRCFNVVWPLGDPFRSKDPAVYGCKHQLLLPDCN